LGAVVAAAAIAGSLSLSRKMILIRAELRGQVSTFNKLSFWERDFLNFRRMTEICRYALEFRFSNH
jgi:hypothetical protein